VTVCHLGVRPRGRLLAEIRAAWKSRISPQMAIWPPSGKISKSNPLFSISISAKGPKFHERRTYHPLRIITPLAPWLQAKHHSTNNWRTKIFLLLFLFFYFYSFLCNRTPNSRIIFESICFFNSILFFKRSKYGERDWWIVRSISRNGPRPPQMYKISSNRRQRRAQGDKRHDKWNLYNALYFTPHGCPGKSKWLFCHSLLTHCVAERQA